MATYLIEKQREFGPVFYIGTSPMGGSEWTTEASEAAQFADALAARMLIERARLADAEVVRL